MHGTTERPIWVGRFERATASELTLSDDIVIELGRHMGLPTTAAAVPAERPISNEARVAFGRGRELWDQRRNFDKMVEHFARDQLNLTMRSHGQRGRRIDLGAQAPTV